MGINGRQAMYTWLIMECCWIILDSLRVIPCVVWVVLEWFGRYHADANPDDYLRFYSRVRRT
jgi:hypothetical protein